MSVGRSGARTYASNFEGAGSGKVRSATTFGLQHRAAKTTAKVSQSPSESHF